MIIAIEERAGPAMTAPRIGAEKIGSSGATVTVRERVAAGRDRAAGHANAELFGDMFRQTGVGHIGDPVGHHSVEDAQDDAPLPGHEIKNQDLAVPGKEDAFVSNDAADRARSKLKKLRDLS